MNFEKMKNVFKKTTLTVGLTASSLGAVENSVNNEHNQFLEKENTQEVFVDSPAENKNVTTENTVNYYQNTENQKVREDSIQTIKEDIQKILSKEEKQDIEVLAFSSKDEMLNAVKGLEESYSGLNGASNEIEKGSFTITSYSKMKQEAPGKNDFVDAMLGDELEMKILNEEGGAGLKVVERSDGLQALDKDYKLNHSGLVDPETYKEPTYKKPEFYFVVEELNKQDSRVFALKLVSLENGTVETLHTEEVQNEVDNWKKQSHLFEGVSANMQKTINMKIGELGLAPSHTQ